MILFVLNLFAPRGVYAFEGRRKELFDLLIQQYGKRLFGLCLHLSANRQDAEDLYQQTWLRAYEKYGAFDPRKSFEGWLTAICVNLYRDRLRRIRRRPLFNAFASGEEKARVLEAVPAPRAPDYSDLERAVNGLRARYRAVVIVHYFEDRNLEKTAELLGLPVGTVKSRLKRARELLKEVLGSEPDF